MTDSRVDRLPRQLMSAALTWLLMTSALVGAEYDATVGYHRRAVQQSANIGGSKLLECDTSEMAGDVFRSAGGGLDASHAGGGAGGGAGSEHIMTWRKQGHEVPIFIQFNGYPPHVDESYQGRIRLVEMTAIEISDLRAQDEGWYECSVVRLEGNDESTVNGSWIYLTINSPPVLGEVSPTFLIQQEGDTVDMFCEATAAPAPSLTWRKDGHELAPTGDDRIRVYGNRVQLRRLQRTDGGAYSCTFTNVVGQASHVIKLVVEGNAYIMVPPSNTTTLEGSRVKLTCQAEGFPDNITYRWYRNDVDVQQTAALMTRAGIYADGSFVINSVQRDDAGWYTCRPTNGLGVPPEASAFLDVTYLPRVTGLPPRVYLTRGLTGRIDCPVDANPPVTIILWARNGVMVDDDGDGPALMGGGRGRRLRTSRHGTLFIRAVEKTDEGRYVCTPYSPLGKGQTSMPVQVLVRDPPYFVVRPSTFYQRQPGQSVVMPCVADGEPHPTITWKKVNSSFPPSTKTMMEAGNLTVVQLGREDAGVYECIASSHIATVVTSTLLIIEQTISHAAHNISVEATHSSVHVCWLPAFDGGSALHHTLWYLAVQNTSSRSLDVWQTMQIVPNDTLCVSVHQLQPSTAYQFMIMSRNLHGDAMYSQPVATSTKDNYGSFGDDNTSDEDDDNDNNDNDYYESGESLEKFPDPDSHYPEFGVPNIGPRPAAPYNVSVEQIGSNLLIKWNVSRQPGSVAVDHYVIQYRTVGQWVPLSTDVAANSTSFLWGTASRGAFYHFRVFAVGKQAHSDASRVVSLRTGDPMSGAAPLINPMLASVIGLLVIAAVVVVVVAAVAKYCIRRRRRSKVTRFGNIKYFGTNQVEGNHNNSSLNDRVRNEGYSSEVLFGAEISSATTTLDNHVGATGHVDKKLKETPI